MSRNRFCGLPYVFLVCLLCFFCVCFGCVQPPRKFLTIPNSLNADWKKLNPHEKHKRVCKYDVTTALQEMSMTFKEFSKTVVIL